MSKHVILEAYTFDKTTNTVTVSGKNIRREQLLLITNVTSGTVIYNFSDPSLGFTSWSNSVSTTTSLETTTIVLEYNCTAMVNTDKLAILTEETYQEITPSETMRDPVDKMRVSTPQSLIDTDFEYGTQPTKWESIQMLNNRPSAFYDPTIYNLISAITSSTTTVSVTMQSFSASTGIVTAGIVSAVTGIASTAGLSAGMALIKQSGAGAFGSGVTTIISVDSATQITVQSVGIMTTGAIVFTQAMPAQGQPIFVQGTLDPAYADGWWLCTLSTPATGIFTYSTIVAPTMVGGTLLEATKSYVNFGTFYTGALIPWGGTAIVTDGTRATVTTTNSHGLRIGDSIFVVATSTNSALNNNWIVERVLTNNTFTFLTAAAAATHTTPSVAGTSGLYPRGAGYVLHRPFDGGVQFSNLSPYHGYQVIRQTRRQFRYQSGKAMQFSTGSILKPALTIDNITSSGATVTVTCKYPHGFLAGSYVKVVGSLDTAYNGIFAVVTVTSPLIFTYTSTALYTAVGNTTALTLTTGTTPTVTPAPAALGFSITVSPYLWYGSANRVGLFDSQNGFFFEYDGQDIYCVKRSSTGQISGTVAVPSGSNTITGTATKFSQELKVGDYIVIRGMSYLVQSIASDTSMFIYPEYRGSASITTGAVVSKTIDTKFNQALWNIDKFDGTGASLYNLDLTKMQMFYMDFSWYGAGSIRFGMKNTRGEVIYCHRITNNNLNTEAYMRSGNIVARYETNSLAPITQLTATLTSGVTSSMTVSDTSNFPSAGILIATQAGNSSGVVEFIQYTGKTATTFTGLTRNYQGATISGAGSAAGGSASATTFTVQGATSSFPAGTAPIRVELHGPSQASSIGHWGSAVIMDGRYDDDKSLVFVGGMNRNQTITNVGQDITVPLLSIRISPSIDNGITGLLGSREIINRMQLVMRSISTITTGTAMAFFISLKLNGRVSGGSFSSVGGSSLAQIAVHSAGTTISGGETIYGFYTSSGVNTEDLTLVRDLGTNILGGGTSYLCPTTANNIYPDGPDIVTICATNVTAVTTNSIAARINWTEAQA